MAAAAANGIPVFDYLLNYSPAPPDPHPAAEMHSNTRSEHYSAADLVLPLPVWTGFTLAEFRRSYGAELEGVLVTAPVVFLSPQRGIPHKAIRCEDQVVQLAVRSIVQQANRALEAASLLIVDTSGAAVIPPGTGADRVGLTDTGALRTVGEVKPSWNWCSAWRQEHPESTLYVQYRQALAQLHYYLNTGGLRYGYLLTDRELVAVRRDPLIFGRMEISEPIK
jgi:hypothetical protein